MNPNCLKKSYTNQSHPQSLVIPGIFRCAASENNPESTTPEPTLNPGKGITDMSKLTLIQRQLIHTTIALFIFLLLFIGKNQGQCTNLIALAQEDIKASKYQLAIEKLLLLQEECPENRSQISALIQETFQRIQGEKDRAETQTRIAQTQTLLAKEQQQKADSLRLIAERRGEATRLQNIVLTDRGKSQSIPSLIGICHENRARQRSPYHQLSKAFV